MKIEDKEYQENYKFWTEKGDEFTLVGDFLGRLPSLKFLEPKSNEVILDAGCGAGFISRKIALSGSKVFGCDRNEQMLKKAKEIESENSFGIIYEKADITKLPYKENFFDKVACVAVLIHDSPWECKNFFDESKRVLKKGGILLVSIMHPYLFDENSPCRKKITSWVNYEPIEDKSMKESQKFNEKYFDSKMNLFSSIVWYHPKDVILNLLNEAGFEVLSVHEQFMTKDVLKKTGHTGPVGYPSFIQFLCKK